MKIIKSGEVVKKANSDKCGITEYPFNDNELDLVIATITGRYPDSGYCSNEVSKELIYVMEGTGTLVLEDKKIDFSKGDAILIYPQEKYYWDSSRCVLSITCNPPWAIDQYKCTD